MLAVRAGFRRGEEAVNLDQGSLVPLAFVFQLSDELTPSYIADGFCKAVVLDQVLDGQTLDADHLVFANDACGKFVLVVTTLVIDTDMHAGYFETRFGAVFRSLLLFGMPPLRFRKGFLTLRVELGITDRFPCRENHHGCEAEIETNRLVDLWQGFNRVLYQHGHKVAIGAVLGDRDRTRFRILGKIPVPVDIQRLSHFCQSEELPIPLERIRSIGSRLAILLLFEGGVLGSSLKEVLECCVQVTKGLLDRHTGDMREPGVLFLEIRQHGSKIIVGELDPTCIGSRAGIQAPVVDKTNTSKRLSKEVSLLIGRIEPKLVCPPVFAHCLLAFLLPLEMFLYCSQDLSIERAIMLFRDLS